MKDIVTKKPSQEGGTQHAWLHTMEKVISSSPYAFINMVRLRPTLTANMGKCHQCNLTLSSNNVRELEGTIQLITRPLLGYGSKKNGPCFFVEADQRGCGWLMSGGTMFSLQQRLNIISAKYINYCTLLKFNFKINSDIVQ